MNHGRIFEKTDFDEVLEDRGATRINRVYRQLAVCPAMYWKENEDADALYLKNQRKWVSKYLQKNLGGNLDIYKNAAFFTMEDRDGYGVVHPRDAMLPEAVLLLCAKLQQELVAGKIRKEENERIVMEKVGLPNCCWTAGTSGRWDGARNSGRWKKKNCWMQFLRI